MTAFPSGFRNSRSGNTGALLLVLALLAALMAAPVSATAQPAPAAATELAGIKPELRDEIAAALPAGLTHYDLSLTFPVDSSRTLQGTSTVTYTNTTGAPLTELPFRLYANGPDPKHGAITIEETAVDGAAVKPAWSVANSVVTVPLAAPLAADAVATVAMRFTVHVPVDASTHYGIFNFATASQTWALAHWYPQVAGRDPETGWMLAPTSVNGDPIFSDTASYDVTITAPADVHLITSGVETGSQPAEHGMTARTFRATPSRDFTIVADADMRSMTREVGGTTVTSWYEPGNDATGEAVAVWAARSLALFNEVLGEYPFTQLQLVQVEIFGAAGVEFPQLVYIGSSYYGREVPTGTSSFEFTVAHEVVHQWFYNLVGNDQYAHAFIDEGLTNYLSAGVYFERIYGEAAASQMVGSYLEAPYDRALKAGHDQIVDQPTDSFSEGGYVMAVYNKAPLGFQAIRQQIGDDAFFSALRAYVHDFRFRVATPVDLRAAFVAASGQDIGPVWDHWFEQHEGS